MTRKEKMIAHRKEMKWLVGISTGPVLFFMWSFPIIHLIGEQWLYKYSIDHLVSGIFSSLFLLMGFIFLKEILGISFSFPPLLKRFIDQIQILKEN